MHSLPPIAGITCVSGSSVTPKRSPVEARDRLAELGTAPVRRVLVRARIPDRSRHRVDDRARASACRGRRSRARSRPRPRPSSARSCARARANRYGGIRLEPLRMASSILLQRLPRTRPRTRPRRRAPPSRSASRPGRRSPRPPARRRRASRSPGSRAPRSTAATAAPEAPVPDDSVSPTPRSKIRARTSCSAVDPDERHVRAVGKQLAAARSRARARRGRAARARRPTSITHCGLPMLTCWNSSVPARLPRARRDHPARPRGSRPRCRRALPIATLHVRSSR